jgi:cobalt-zinc-cadmium efflux system membrane fusion protein
VNLGDNVKAGQVLAGRQSQEMAQYSSDLLNAETNLNIAQKNLEKTVDMFHSGLASVTDSLSRKSHCNRPRQKWPGQPGTQDQRRQYPGRLSFVKAPISGFIVQKGRNQ